MCSHRFAIGIENGAAPRRSCLYFWLVDKVRRQCFTKIDTIKLMKSFYL